MRNLILLAISLLIASGAGCTTSPRRTPPGKPHEARIDYWLTKMKGVDPAELSDEQKTNKDKLLTLAWKQLVLAGKPAAKRIRQELDANPKDAYFQLSASMVLYQIEGNAAHPDIIMALQRTSIEDNRFQYFYLCHRLARSRDEAVLPVLERLLANKKVFVFIDKDSPILDPRTVSVYLYGVFGPGAIPALKKACADKSPTVRANAAAVLGYFADDDPLFVLADLLTDDRDEEVRAAAANALGQVNHVAAIRPLAGVLTTDKSPSVRAACAFGLGEIQHEACINGLAISLNDVSRPVRQCSINSLEYIGTEACSNVVANRLALEKDPDVRFALIKALGHLGYDKWLDLLRKVSADGSGAEATAAAESIRRIVAMGPRTRQVYPDLDGSKVSPAKLSKILTDLCNKFGEGIDRQKKTIYLSAGKDDLGRLEELRCRVLWVVNAQSMDRLAEAGKLMRLVKRKIRDMP